VRPDTAPHLRQLLATDAIHIVPELADCAAAKAAEMNGFEIIMISSGDLATSLTGIPDLQLLSLDEFVFMTDRITNMTSMPLIIDADNGFGRPINAYYACQRLRKAGAAGVLITDAAEEGRDGVLSIDEACLKFQAAREGLGPNGYLVARVDTNPETEFEETIRRSLAYREAGADMICILWMHKVPGDRVDLCRRIHDADPGPKWYPDLSTRDGKPELDIDDLVPYNYRMTGVHFSSHAAMLAMLAAGRDVFETRTNVYVDTAFDHTGYKFMTSMSLYGLADGTWPALERKWVKNPQDAIAVRNAEYFVREGDRY
jgi:methylisocitrate lyase